MRTELLTPFVEISGGRTATIRVEVYNTGSVIDGVTARIVGVDPSWVQLPIEVTSLFPDTSEIIELALTLPRSYAAGRHTVALEVRSTIDPREGAVHHVVLDVAPAEDARLEVFPKAVTGRKRAKFRAEVQNRGNRPIELSVTAADTVRALSAEIIPPALTVPPGEMVESTILVAGRRPFFGSPATRQLVVQANGGEHQLESVVRFTQKPVVARGFMTMLILAGIILLWALVFTFAIRYVTGSEQDQKTVAADFVTGAVDLDGDGIISMSNSQGQNEEGTGSKDDIDVADIAGTIAGAITAESTGDAVARLTVEAYRDTRDGPLLVASVATDDSGAYELAGLLPGIYRLRYLGPGFVEVWYPAGTGVGSAQPQSLEPVGKLDLPIAVEGQPGTFRGTVLVDVVEGAPQPPILITVREPLLDIVSTTTSNPDGSFEVSGLPTPGNYEITYENDDFRNQTVLEPLGGGENKLLNTVKLGAAEGSLAGTVTDGTTALGGVTVILTRGDTVVETTTPTSGGGIGSFLFPMLTTPGTYVITFELEGYETQTQAVDLGPGEGRSGFDVQLVGGAGTVSGLVRDQNGNPLPGVAVTVSGGGFAASVATLSAGQPGSYSVGDVPTPGNYTVTFSLPGFRTETRSVSLTGGGPVTDVNMTLVSAVGTVEGTVSIGGAPTGGVSVELNNGQNRLITTTASGTGQYRFTTLAPGSYTVTVDPGGGATPTVELVNVEAGASVVVEFDL